MADAEDLKSSGDFSSCGFDSHPGHQSFLLMQKELRARLSPCTCRVPYDDLGVGSDFVLSQADLVPMRVSNLLPVVLAGPSHRRAKRVNFPETDYEDLTVLGNQRPHTTSI